MSAALSRLDNRRGRAAERFRRAGVPNRLVEAWKYTDLNRAVDAEAVSLAGDAQWRLGKLPEGVEVCDLSSGTVFEWAAENLGSGDGVMADAALGFAQSGVALRATGAIDEPVTLAFTSAGHAHVVVVLEPGAALTLLERHEAGDGLRNIGMDVVLGDGATFTHARLADAAPDQARVETVTARLAKNARYVGNYADLGGKLSRLDMELVLEGGGASVDLSGVGVVADERHADVTTHVEHRVANTQSTQLFKYVAGGTARGVYQGKVTVREGAYGSDSNQTAKGLLLHDRAEIDLKPELEILADDVKCAHGAAIGDLDPESLFYLRSRGLPETEARTMLIRAFLEDALAAIEREDIRAALWDAVEDALRGAA